MLQHLALVKISNVTCVTQTKPGMSVKRGKHQWSAYTSTTTSASKWNILKTMTLIKDLSKPLSRCVAGRRCVRTKNAGTKTKPVISIVAITTCVMERQGDLTRQAHCWPLCLLFCCACCNCVVYSELASWRMVHHFSIWVTRQLSGPNSWIRVKLRLPSSFSASSISGWLEPIRFKKRLVRIATGLDPTEWH